MISTKITEIENLLENTFIVALSETEGMDINTGKITNCEVSKAKVKKRIAIGTSSEMKNLILNKFNDISEKSEQEESFQTTGFSSWAEKIAKKASALTEKEGDHDNS